MGPTLSLSLRDFTSLAKGGVRVPLSLVVPNDTLTPVGAFLAIARDAPQSFLFESVEGGEHHGRWTFMGVKPRAVVRWSLGKKGHPLELVRRSLQRKTVAVPGLPPFAGGVVGSISYDAVRAFEPRVPCRHPDELGFPDAVWMDFDTTIAFDQVRHQVHLTQLVETDGVGAKTAYARAEKTLRALWKKLLRPPPSERRSKTKRVTLKPRISRRAFVNAVRTAQEAVKAGDCQQIVLSQRFDAESDLHPFDLFRALRRVNPSPYLFYLRDQARVLVGSSPETLVKVTHGKVVLRPIAGTRPRGHDADEDARLEAELRADVKENAEHVMLVDLGRNDVGRVSKVGSVRVTELKVVERYSHVMHLVSQVEGELRKGLDAADVLEAAFPAGTVSGSPKVRAMELIDQLEATRRGPYAGAVGYVDAFGNMDLAIAIRTLMQNGRRLSAQAGAGIVYDSDPEAEYQETLNKARAVFRALEAAQGER